jgi:hypothetical protein
MAVMMYRLRAALQGFCRRLSRFMTRHFIDRKSEWADELGENVGQDARFLRLQLTKARAENTDLKSQTKDFGERFAALFHMPDDGLREIVRSYEIRRKSVGTSCEVVLEHCVFCGDPIEVKVFQHERDALLYVALLQTAGYQPQRNLSCPLCYTEYEKSLELSKD